MMIKYSISICILCLLVESLRNIYSQSHKDKFIFNIYLQWIFIFSFSIIVLMSIWTIGWIYKYTFVYLLINIVFFLILIKMFKILNRIKNNKHIKDFLDFKRIDDKSFFYIMFSLPIIILYIISFFIGII